jgi:hypothetical protein
MENTKRKTMTALLLSLSVLLVCVSVFASACGKEKEKPAEEETPAEPVRYYWPLTGLEASSEEATLLRPISIKIENYTDARPQLGMQDADIVYETIVEGGITRFNCIFQSTLPEEVGPVRSARLSDLWIVPQYDALFYFAGGNKQVSARIAASNISDLKHRINSPYHRISYRKAPHNLYLFVKEVYDDATKAKFDINAKTVRSFLFGDLKGLKQDAADDAAKEDDKDAAKDAADTDEAADADTASAAEPTTPAYPSGVNAKVGFVTLWECVWKYDAASGTYLREQGGAPFMMAETDKQVYSENVVILVAHYTRQTPEQDHAKGYTYDTDLGGSGKAWVLRDGVSIECTWKADESTPPRFYDADGTEIPLKPGHTWIEVAGEDTKVTVE